MGVAKIVHEVSIDQEEAEILLNHYNDQLQKIYDQIADAKHKADLISEKAARLKRILGQEKTTLNPEVRDAIDKAKALLQEYLRSWTLYKKCIYALTASDRLLTTRQIAVFIIDTEHLNPSTFEQLQKDIGATLYQKVNSGKDKEVLRIKQDGSNEFFYGLKEWFDSEGSLKEKYKKQGH